MDKIASAMLKMEPLKLILLGDAMYFHAAKRNYEHAMQNRKALKKAESAMQRLEDRKERILAKYGGDAVKAYDELESICIQMDGAGYEIGRAYAPILQGRVLAFGVLYQRLCKDFEPVSEFPLRFLNRHIDLKSSEEWLRHFRLLTSKNPEKIKKISPIFSAYSSFCGRPHKRNIAQRASRLKS